MFKLAIMKAKVKKKFFQYIKIYIITCTYLTEIS